MHGGDEEGEGGDDKSKEADMINRTRQGPKGVGKGTVNTEKPGGAEKKKKSSSNKFNNIGTHLERARYDESREGDEQN
jgi:hypothetical protein